MNTATTPDSSDAIDQARDDLPQSLDGLPVAVAPRLTMEVGAGGPVRRSPPLSCLLPPQPPVESQDTQDLDESIDDESESVDDVALQLSRSETPENDDLPPDEPSTVLANRIIRAHDNPSPPPQDLMRPDANYVPGKDGQFPQPTVSVPPSPFRDINLLEHLNQSSEPIFNLPRSSRTTTLGVRRDMSDCGIFPARGFVSSESSFALVASVPMKGTVDGLSSRSPRHVCEPVGTINDGVVDSPLQPIAGLHGQLITITSSHEPNSPLTQAVGSSSNLIVPSASKDNLCELLPCSERRQSEPSPLPSSAKLPPPPPSNGNGKASPGIETITPHGEEKLSVDDDRPRSIVEKENNGATSIKEVDACSLQGPDFLPPQSLNAPVMHPLPSESTSPINPTTLSAKSILVGSLLTTPPRTPTPSVTRPNFSQTSVQRPVIAPTPVRTNLPAKLLLEAHGVCRTPARRVPIESAIARGTPSIQRVVQLSAQSDQSRPGGASTIRAPTFTRPALDDPSRSPAKRILVMNSVTSPTKGRQAQSPSVLLGTRARSASIEPHTSGTILTRSRSVDPCTMISKLDSHETKEAVFPVFPVLARAGTRLPFPFASGSDLPPPIPEEHESVGVENTGTNAALTQSNKMSQLRQPSTSSRIPRIGNKPYARPPRDGKATSTTTARVPRTFQVACKKAGEKSNAGVSSTEHANDRLLVSQGSLKRKRGTEAAVSHPVVVRQVVPGILSQKYAPKNSSQVQGLSASSPSKAPQPLKFRKVVDGMLSARYAPTKVDHSQTEPSESTSLPPSPLSELSSSSDDEYSGEKPAFVTQPSVRHDILGTSRIVVGASAVEPSTRELSTSHEDVDHEEPSSRPRRTSRARKPAQQQYVLDVFNGNTTTRPPPARRKPQSRTESDCFMGMSATALKALTTSNTTKNQQTVAVLATEVIRKEGLRPESPTVKARTILQKQRDERDMRRRERAQRRTQMCGEDPVGKGTEGQSQLDEHPSLGARADHGENGCAIPSRHSRGPGDEEDYETPEQPERTIEPLRYEGLYRKAQPVKQVKWHRGLSTASYPAEADTKPKSLPKNDIVRGCLAPTSKSLPLDCLGNLVDLDDRPCPELVTEHIIVKKYIYDNDIEPEPIPAKATRSRSKKGRG